MPAKSAKRPPTAPSAVVVRMYNVGFGDCFLLTFRYPSHERHMLIDFGSTAPPRRARLRYMSVVADDIRKQCNGKLHVLVATHRHCDHISGFATQGAATGSIIASLHPDVVIQPWTEDPNARTNAPAAAASSYRQGKPDPALRTAHFLGALEDMHRIAAMALRRAAATRRLARSSAGKQLAFLGEDNLKNLSAVRNLMKLGNAGQALYVNAGMKLNTLLPGVKITVLGPPTLEQSESIRRQRASDPAEFWQFRGFWASQRLSAEAFHARRPDRLFPSLTPLGRQPQGARWFIAQANRIQADQMLELVRDLDRVMNNTSVILLLEIGDRKLLFPGDAQIENWSFALANPQWKALLEDVDLYKVGHHGSLNATPKTLWSLFRRKNGRPAEERLATLCSTRSGKHGNVRAGTEVPRRTLVEEFQKYSRYESTEEYAAADNPCRTFTISIS